MNNNKSARRGFTLVEIMIVVVIIGLLAAMAIPAFSKVRSQSRIKAVTNNLRQFGAAAQQYMLDKGVTQAVYADIVGATTDKYLRDISVVGDEDYSSLTVAQTTTQISISGNAIGTVTYNL